MTKLDQNFLLFNYFNQLDLKDLVDSNDHLELLNSNLEFYLKLMFKSKDNFIKNNELINFLSNVLIKILNNNQIKLNENETKFIILICELFSLYNDNDLNNQLNLLILNSELIDLELKIQIIQCLFEKKLVSSNSRNYINFIFKSLDNLFNEISKSSTINQQKTKLINNIIWIIFDFLKHDLFSNFIIENLDKFLNKIIFNTNDDQLVELNLDLIASLNRFNSEKDNEIKIEYIEKLKFLINNDKIKNLIINSSLNKFNSSIRKKSRYIANQLNLLPLDVLEVLESLEERQLHLIKPILDNKLNSIVLKNLKLNIESYDNVIEIIIERILNHDCRNVKLYAFKFLKDQYQLKKDQFFLSNNFILNQMIITLNDNQIFNEEFYKSRSLEFLNLVSIDQILKSLLDKQSILSPFGLFFIFKQLNSKTTQLNDSFSSKFHKFDIQKLFQIIQLISSDTLIRSTTEIYLIKILINNLTDKLDDFKFLLDLLSLIKIKELNIQNLFIDYNLDQFKCHLNNLDNDYNLIGLARYCSIVYSNYDLDQFNYILNKFNDDNAFLINFLNSINTFNGHLWNYLNEENLINNLEVLQLVCIKKIDNELSNNISKFLIQQFNQQTNPIYLALLDDLICANNLNDDLFYKLLNNLFNTNNLKLDILDRIHWKLVNKYLDKNIEEFNVDQLINYFNQQETSNSEFILNLISRSSFDLNSKVIEFLSLIFKNELINSIEINKTNVLKNYFILSDLIFNSCQEVTKVYYYIELFSVFIEKFAFNSELFRSKEAKLYLNDNIDKLGDLFDKIYNINTLQVKSILINHICNLIKNDTSLIKDNLFENLLINAIKIGCLFDRDNFNLFDYFKEEIKLEEKNIINCLNYDIDLEFYKETRLNALSICLKLDLEILNKLINEMIKNENRIYDYTKVGNYINSHYHREQNKILQFLIMINLRLLNQLNNQSDLKIINTLKLIFNSTIRNVIYQNSSQLSVKLLQQLIIISLIRNDQCPIEFYDQFKELLSFNSNSKLLLELPRNKENEISKIGFIVSLLTILFHLIDKKPDIKYYPLNYLLTCNHYRTRLYSYLVLSKGNVKVNFTTEEDNKLELETTAKSISGSNNVIKNLNLLKDDWFFSLLDCDKDLNLVLIFNLLPKLTGLDDLIRVELLEKYFDLKLIDPYGTYLKLSNSTKSDLNKHSIIREFENNLDNKKEIFQTKHISEPELEFNSNRNKRIGNLMICASLIDRAPNLGGLTRTSEIFGIKKLLIPNNHILKDKEYLNLTVSAERWVDIEEVFYWNLIDYLKDLKKNFNYSLIGIEQSTESLCLTKFKFPKKSIIVLGNEKEGLPVELLQMMDYCIEIPQTGIIKSLNVHVTGAIIAWEYAKQHNFYRD